MARWSKGSSSQAQVPSKLGHCGATGSRRKPNPRLSYGRGSRPRVQRLRLQARPYAPAGPQAIGLAQGPRLKGRGPKARGQWTRAKGQHPRPAQEPVQDQNGITARSPHGHCTASRRRTQEQHDNAARATMDQHKTSKVTSAAPAQDHQEIIA